MQAVLEYTQGALQPGARLGPYRLIKRLKRGGMSTVYLGYHIRTRAYVAMKVVDSYAVDLKMVYREREIMQALEHEHIVPCLDAGEHGRYHYLVMPYLPGGTLQDMLAGSVLTLEEACSILAQRGVRGGYPPLPAAYRLCAIRWIKRLENLPGSLENAATGSFLPQPLSSSSG